jgi:hypothetical protein
MITVNVSGLNEVVSKLNSLDINKLCFEVASTLKAEIKHRVHVKGLASDGSPIGTYSSGYMKVRTGNYPETVITRGKNKGKFRDEKDKEGQAGYFTKGKNKGKPRPRYNRKSETNVILSLTRQMENDMNATDPIPITNGFGIGYSNEFSYNKAVWNEKRYGKSIWDLTKEEMNVTETIVQQYVDKINR